IRAWGMDNAQRNGIVNVFWRHEADSSSQRWGMASRSWATRDGVWTRWDRKRRSDARRPSAIGTDGASAGFTLPRAPRPPHRAGLATTLSRRPGPKVAAPRRN